MKLRPNRFVDGPYFLAALVAVGAILRLVAIERDSLWFDEAISYLTATLPVEQILGNAVQSSHPPLYYLLLKLWMIVMPDSDGALRLLGVIWSLLLIPALYLLTVEILGQRRLAAWSALFVTVSPFQILFSHELRMYTQLMLLVTLGVFSFLRAVSRDRLSWWVLTFFLFAGAIYTHVFAWLVLVALGIYCLMRYRWQRPTRILALLSVILLIVFSPWLIQLVGENRRDLGTLRPLAQDTSRNPLKLLTSAAFLIFGTSVRPWFTGLVLFLTISIGIVLILEVRKAIRNREGTNLLLPGLIVVVVLLIPNALYLIRPYFLPERTLAAAAPFLLILLAWATTRRGSPLPFLVIATAMLMFLGSLMYLTGGRVKPPYRSVMNLVSDKHQENDYVLHTSDGSYVPALRYVDFGNHALLAGDPDPRKPDAVYHLLGGRITDSSLSSVDADRLWLIVALEHSLEWQQDQAATIGGRYTLLEEHYIGGIGIFLYDLGQPDEEGS